jgi:dihydroneopterin triphosphate diphosphatase
MVSHDLYRIPIQVALYCYRLNNGAIEWLMLKRSTPTNPCWQGVTGAPFEGESLGDAAQRELYEETGLHSQKLIQIDYWYSYPIPTYNKHKFAPNVHEIKEYVFAAQISALDKGVKLSEEHADYHWVDFDSAFALLSWPENKKSLEIAYNMLVKNL